MPKGKTHVDVETFVTTWQKGENIVTVAKTLGCTPGNCRSRANRLRKAGVKLREFPRMSGAAVLDVKRLNELAVKAYAEACEQPSKKRAAS